MGDVSAAVARMPAEIELNLMRQTLLERVRPQTTTAVLKSDIEHQQATIITQQATIAELQEKLDHANTTVNIWRSVHKARTAQLDQAYEIITLMPIVAFHAPYCRSQQAAAACDCGLSGLLQMAREWLGDKGQP